MRLNLDAKVRAHDGEEIGSVDRAVFDPRSNQVTHIVLRTGTLFGRDIMIPREDIEDKTLILADVSRKALRQVHTMVRETLCCNGMAPEKAEDVATLLSSGTWTHDYPIDSEHARGLGLPVSEAMPKEVYTLMALYPQPTQRRPSVEYVPIPYERQRQPRPGREIRS